MATFRVYIRRPTTKSPIWDWAQTVVSPTPQQALQDAYASWLQSDPQPAPPALAQCPSNVKQIT